MASGKENWKAVSRDCPCPKCGKPDNCKISLDGRAVWCGRVTSDTQNAGGQCLHKLSEDNVHSHPTLGDSPPPKKKSAPRGEIDWQKNTAYFIGNGADRLHKLAEEWNVPIEILQRLEVGMTQVKRQDNWTFPERNSSGEIIGIGIRNCATGSKRTMSGSNRGLTFSKDWHATPGPIFLVEGPSDVAAGMAKGLCVVGRPSNCGGVRFLAKLLRPHGDREIIVLGENDLKENGQWPGKKGAIATAEGLANEFNRKILWALPPDGFKDLREYYNSPETKPPWILKLQEVEPSALLEPIRGPSGPLRELKDWREGMVKARLKALETPGICFDGSPTGAGKSSADHAAMQMAKSSLTLVPTHQNGDEAVYEMKKAGLDAEKLPARASPEEELEYLKRQESKASKVPWNYGVCTNMKEVERAESLGLSASATICPTCSFKDRCNFLETWKHAMSAPHLVATHHMFANNSKSLCQAIKLICVHEKADDMIRPLIKLDCKELNWLYKVAAEGSSLCKRWMPHHVNTELVFFFDCIHDIVKDIQRKIDEASETVVIQSELDSIKCNQKRLFEACISLFDRQQLLDSEVCPVGMRFIIALIEGRIERWVIKVPQGSNGVAQEKKSIVAVLKTELPTDATIIFSDATGRAEDVQELTGLPVKDITPHGHLERKSSVVQIPHDINRSTNYSTVVKLIAALMARYPQSAKIGIIGHRPHIVKLTSSNSQLGALVARIHKTAYFGEGTERASNEWLAECDLIVVLGTPRLPVDAITDWMIQRGRLKEMLLDGGWGPRLWEAETVGGGRLAIKGVGYSEPVWRRAAEALVRAPLLQAVGRARCYQESGIPAIVCSNEPLGLPVAEAKDEPTPLSKAALKCFLWLECQIAKTLNNIYKGFCNLTTAEVATGTGLSTDRCSKALKELTDLGYLNKLGHGKWAIAKDDWSAESEVSPTI
jgi:hypothetical protein